MNYYKHIEYLNIISIDNLPVAPGMSNTLEINQNYQNTTLNICATNTILENEWAEDVGGFWDDEVPEIINEPDTIPEPISVDEIDHIKVINNHFNFNCITLNILTFFLIER